MDLLPLILIASAMKQLVDAGMIYTGRRFRRGITKNYDLPPKPTVYFYYDTQLDEQTEIRRCIQKAMNNVKRRTCLKLENHWEQKTPPKDHGFIVFNYNEDKKFCSATSGLNRDGPTFVNLGASCGKKELTCTRLLLRALGIENEHERPDRDAYIKTHLQNVRPGDEIFFTKRLVLDDYDLATAYDISSVMHFGPQEHSRTNENVIEARDILLQHSVGSQIRGPGKMLSHRDLKTINELFQCSKQCARQLECQHGGYMDGSCRCQCPYGFKGKECTLLSKSQNFNVFKPENKVSECGYVMAKSSGYITSPKFPKRYPRGAFCQWIIQAEHSWQRIEFKFETVDLEYERTTSSQCLDKLTVWPHGTDVMTPPVSCIPEMVEKYVGKVHRTQSNWLLVELKSDQWGENEPSGFNLSYRLIGDDPNRQRVSRNDAVVFDKEMFEIRDVLKNMTTRLRCFSCDGPACNQSLRYLPTVECGQMEACGVVVGIDGDIGWRGCLHGDKCITEAGIDCRLTEGRDPYCGTCCANHYCNSSFRVKLSLSTLLFSLLLLLSNLKSTIHA